MQAFCGDQRKTLLKVKPHLAAKNAARADACPVAALKAVLQDILQESVILLHGGASR